MTLAITEKTCRSCGQTKPVSAFHHARLSPDGYMANCRECRTQAREARHMSVDERILHGETMRKCAACGELRAMADYVPDRRYLDGLYPVCRVCMSATRKKLSPQAMTSLNAQQYISDTAVAAALRLLVTRLLVAGCSVSFQQVGEQRYSIEVDASSLPPAPLKD